MKRKRKLQTSWKLLSEASHTRDRLLSRYGMSATDEELRALFEQAVNGNGTQSVMLKPSSPWDSTNRRRCIVNFKDTWIPLVVDLKRKSIVTALKFNMISQNEGLTEWESFVKYAF